MPKKTGAGFNRGASKQNYATPDDFMQAFTNRFGPIAFDLAADETNFKHANHFTVRDNSLAQEWHKIPGNLWLNPPFDNIAPWAKKCAAESVLGATVFFLVPASVGSNWFRDYVFERSWVYFLNGRLCFNGIAGYPKDCVLCQFLPPHRREHDRRHGFEVWTWK